MKVKSYLLLLLVVISLVAVSCSQQACPAYSQSTTDKPAANS